MNIKRRPKSDAVNILEKMLGSSLTCSSMLEAIREGEELTQTEFAKILNISRSHLCDIENGRKNVSPRRAASFARILGYSEEQFVRLALQAIVDEANLKLKVYVKAA